MLLDGLNSGMAKLGVGKNSKRKGILKMTGNDGNKVKPTTGQGS